ncbi:hypothetical protein KVV02_002469, partial [Mortierella alpina]
MLHPDRIRRSCRDPSGDTPSARMEIVDDAAFSFRRKKTTKGSSSPSTAARLPVSQPSSTNSSAPTLDDVIASSLPSPVKAIGLPVAQSPAAQPSSGEQASWELAGMRKRCRHGHNRAAGDVGLLLRVSPKPGPSTKKKGMMPSLAKQDHNPFMIPSAAGAAPPLASIASKAGRSHLQKVYQEASMFLVYSVLDGDKASTQDDTPYTKMGHRSSNSENNCPAISFLARPLVELSEFLEQTFLNTRSMEQLQRDLEDDEGMNILPHMDTMEHVHYEDAIVDTIMNGCGEEYESGYGSEKATVPDIEGDEDESLHQELELLTALERSKTWSPYTVVPPPNTDLTSNYGFLSSKDAPKERTLARTQTLNRMAF